MRMPLSLALIASLVLSTAPVGAQVPTSDWARVVTIASGTAVVVTVQNSKPVRRRIVHADESTLTVLNPSTQVAEAVARGDVLEIRTEGRLSDRRRALGLLGGLGGAIGGAFVGGMVGGKLIGGDGEDLGGVAVGMFAGVVGGAVLGYRAVTRTKGDLIYRAP
jgi:hypothetical protein